MEIKNVVVNIDGKEIGSEEILKSIDLQQLVSRTIIIKGLSTLISKINEEYGELYIYADSELVSKSLELRNVSRNLQDEYYKISN